MIHLLVTCLQHVILLQAVKLSFHLVSFTLRLPTFSVVFLLALSPMVGQHKPFKDSELRKIAHLALFIIVCQRTLEWVPLSCARGIVVLLRASQMRSSTPSLAHSVLLKGRDSIHSF